MNAVSYTHLLNEDTVTGPVVEINSLYRFSEIFQDLLHNMGDSEYLRHLFDAAVHILAAQETLSGLSKRDFYVQMLKRELEGGGFSASIAQALQLLSEEQKRGVASLLLAQYETCLLYTSSYLQFYKDSKDAFIKVVKPLVEKLLGVKMFFDQYKCCLLYTSFSAYAYAKRIYSIIHTF